MEDEEMKKMQEKIEELEKQVKSNDNPDKKIELGNNTYNLGNKYVNYKIAMGIVALILAAIFIVWIMVQQSESQARFNHMQNSFNKNWNSQQKSFNKDWNSFGKP